MALDHLQKVVMAIGRAVSHVFKPDTREKIEVGLLDGETLTFVIEEWDNRRYAAFKVLTNEGYRTFRLDRTACQSLMSALSEVERRLDSNQPIHTLDIHKRS